jgi:putative PIN family toxin of toxin-antitoxin system
MNFVLRLILDTNILVSAALKRDSLQHTIFLLALTKSVRLYISQPILDEYAEVLSRPKLGISKGVRQQMIQLIKNHSHMVVPARTLNVTTDPDDNIFLECAEAARADYLVTGNRKHFPIFWKNTKVINSNDFISLIAPQLLG